MADVRRRWEGDASERDRGQLILVTALALAIMFVSLALILNTAIYTENLATRGSDIGGGTEAVRFHETVRSGVGGLMAFANVNKNTSHPDIQSELEAGVVAIDNRTGRLFAVSDRSVTARLEETENGTRIAQTDDTRAFTDTTGGADWSVVADVYHTRAFTINVTDAAPLQPPDTGDEFQIVLEDGDGDEWIINVTNDSSTSVGINNTVTDETFTCPASPTPVIDVTAGTVNGTACDGLDLADDLDTPYEISIENGDNVTGTYTFIVDNVSLANNVATNPNLDAPGGQPFATFAVYSANVTAVYQSPRLYYNATIRVAPEEGDG